MIVVRDVFQAKYGKGGPLVEHIKSGRPMLGPYGRGRILADLSGRFDTIVVEAEFDSLTAWESAREQVFADPGFPQWFQEMLEFVDHGSREFWSVTD